MYDRTDSFGKPLTVRNANYKEDIAYTTRISRYILTPIGIWPTMFERVGKFIPIILIVICNLAMCSVIIPTLHHAIYKEENFIIQLKYIGPLTLAAAACLKYFILSLRRSIIAQCIKHVEEDWKLVEWELDRTAMLKYGRVGRNLAIVCSSLLYTGCIMYHMVLPFVSNGDDDQSEDRNSTTKNVVYPQFTTFFDTQKSPAYEFLLSGQYLTLFVMYSATAGGYNLAALFALHTCGQMEIVLSHLMDFVDGDIFQESSDVNVRLKTIVQRHLRVLGFAKLIERMLQEVCLVELAGSTFLICLIQYYCIAVRRQIYRTDLYNRYRCAGLIHCTECFDWNERDAEGWTTYILFFISLTFNVFIICYIGELITEKTSYIGETCFMIEWYRLPIETSRGLILIMGMSSNPVKITAGKMIDLSISTFGNVLKTSLVYLSFLRTAVLN